MKEIEFNLHKQYLFGCLLFIQAKTSRRDHSTLQVFLSLQIETTQKSSKVATVNIFSPVSILWMQLVSKNIFHSQ